jgi:predicted RNA binding protein YcfA (HicA-like mRNA interferase family)
VSRLTPEPWKTLRKVFEAVGFTVDRIAGSHLVMTKPGVARPVVIPMYPQVGTDIIQSNLRTAGLSREQYLKILASL